MTDHEQILRRLEHLEYGLIAVQRDAIALSRDCVALLGRCLTGPQPGGMTPAELQSVIARVNAQTDKLAATGEPDPSQP